jgi:hypothetical protein
VGWGLEVGRCERQMNRGVKLGCGLMMWNYDEVVDKIDDMMIDSILVELNEC